MGSTTAIIKYLVFFFNFLCLVMRKYLIDMGVATLKTDFFIGKFCVFQLLGIAVIVINVTDLNKVAEESRPILIFFIVIGSVVFLISFFGCCGAIKENVCLSWTYASTLLVLLILTCVLVFDYAKRFDAHQVAQIVLDDAWKKQLNNTDAMSIYQTKFNCCGVNGTSDYTKANLKVPQSCYANSTSTTTYTEGCLTKVEAAFEAALSWGKTYNWILIAVEAGTFLSGTILAISFKNEQRRSRY